MLRILRQVEETPSIRTVMLDGPTVAIPGQFAMVWVPGIDEFPMSVSYIGRTMGITYQVIGDGTKALAAMGPGEFVGIRGPYGRGFSLIGRRLLVVAGRTGMAPLAPLVSQAVRARRKVDVVIGARSADELLFMSRAARAGAKVHVSTDDGSLGFRGFASELADELLRKNHYDAVYACGPEQMIVKIVRICSKRGVPLQASLERLMKCGIGVCDSCAIDGVHVCRDGPVFGLSELRRFKDLGRTKLDLAGRRTPV